MQSHHVIGDLSQEVRYPKVLICTLTRVNSQDSLSNNLLLRNLFADWPRNHIAQIYSGGSNGDDGFCGYQRQIGPDDRRFGNVFFKLKGECKNLSHAVNSPSSDSVTVDRSSSFALFKQIAGQLLIDTGLYELIFKLQPSAELIEWAKKFDPDIILAQGYNLSFCWLPLLLKKQLQKPIAYYCSDDWPSYLYTSQKGLGAITAPLMRRIVSSSTRQLLAATDVPFSFNDMMGDEYERRYGKHFTALMHCDDPERFILADPIRLHPPEIKSIVATGAFDDSRWPLLLDLEQACRQLNDMGIPARATVLTGRITKEGHRRVKECLFVELQDDPGHELLPSYLKGADLLFLPETFDPVIAEGYRYSISTKAHLFMFSQRPILVYGHPACGLVNYATRDGWASVVNKSNIDQLVESLRSSLFGSTECKEIVSRANQVVMRNNNCVNVRKVFRSKVDILHRFNLKTL